MATAYEPIDDDKIGNSPLYHVFNVLFIFLPKTRLMQFESLYGKAYKITGKQWRNFHSRFEADWTRSAVFVSATIRLVQLVGSLTAYCQVAIIMASDVGLLAAMGLEHIRSASAVLAIVSICFSLASLISTMMLSFSMGSDLAVDDVVDGVSHRVRLLSTNVLIVVY